MEEDGYLHEIFIKDPVESLNFVGSFVKIVLENNENITGTVYTIDPVSQSVILFKRENSEELTLKIIFKHAITSIEKLLDVPEGQQNVIDENIFMPEKSSLIYSKEDVKNWLEKNMIPVTENGDRLVIDTLEIHPPYGIDQCYCNNSIVLARIQNLLKQMYHKKS